MKKLHENEVVTDETVVARLVAEQFPRFASLPVRPVESSGTDNALYRLGTEFVVRLPKIDWAVEDVDKEQKWLPRLAPSLPLAIPKPVARGEPAHGYPWPWSIYEWIAGDPATNASPANLVDAAVILADFLHALQRCDARGAPDAKALNSRGAPLAGRDRSTREALGKLPRSVDGTVIDRAALESVWETALQAPGWHADPVWFHGDLLPGNVLIREGRLAAIIDFGGMGAGDPACDLFPAWALFAGESRAAFRDAVAVDDATWIRARGLTISQAVIYIPYYLHTNPAGVRDALGRIDAVLTDPE